MMKFIGKNVDDDKKKRVSMNNKLSDDGWILIHYQRKTWFMNKPLLNLIDPTQRVH